MPVISTNTAANTALRYLNGNTSSQALALAKLASGSTIVRASDNAAGLAIATQLQGNISALSQAETNAAQAASMLQTADGGMTTISDIIQRMMALATQAAAANVTDAQRSQDIQTEYAQLSAEINNVASGTRYAGQSLLDGTGFSGTQSFLVGTAASDVINVVLSSCTTASSGPFSLTANGAGASSYAALINDMAAAASGSLSDLTISQSGTTVTLTTASSSTAPLGDALNMIGFSGSSATGSNPTTYTMTFSTTAAATNYAAMAGIIKNDVGKPYSASGSGPVTVTGPAGTSSTDASQLATLGGMTVSGISGSAGGLGITGDLTTQSDAQTMIGTLSAAMSTLTELRASIGAYESQFTFASQSLSTTRENAVAANSSVMDADVAAEKSHLAAADVKVQSSIAALSQASKMPQELLSLLQQ